MAQLQDHGNMDWVTLKLTPNATICLNSPWTIVWAPIIDTSISCTSLSDAIHKEASLVGGKVGRKDLNYRRLP
jgi:hypothetical protein